MRKTKKRTLTAPQKPSVEAFSFGDPVPVLDRREIFDYLECSLIDNYYEPPMSFEGLSRIFRAAAHHSSAIYVKRNILSSTFVPHPWLSRQDFDRFALDFLIFGNAYLERRKNGLNKTIQLKSIPAKLTRRGEDLATYYLLHAGFDSVPFTFQQGHVFHLLEPDINQEIYGLPEYLAAMTAILLNESATLFRRKYYLNGSHAGYILYISDAAQNLQDIDNIREQLKSSKGLGNFRNLFLYAPNGKKDGIQTIPLSEAAAKDEFLNIKNVSRDDMLAAHRVPPQLMGIMPQNVGGFGDVQKAANVFICNELHPLQHKMQQLNEWLGEEVIQFTPYALNRIKNKI
ncbi:phage portal protein (plasmid) [Arsenophonus nasoniae]|uniref:Phage portal protein n=1 Tax=Arsenophonus nasoniae TaxID=638 RepID=A0ABY8NV04_9GAMM|nr:phage portal protein [Arsenophonus nasoniae]WGM08245.1 phage portal protein [Arsenophonus nasoniae]WGM13099.1 phage portal protein [Arsenophonus nasoniae]WGM17672.1 phage portal protein [Arsenophonus nasoniae]